MLFHFGTGFILVWVGVDKHHPLVYNLIMKYENKCKQCNKSFSTVYYTKVYCSQSCKTKAGDKRRARQSKKNVIDILGGKCTKCGFSDIRALQIDHINGGGVNELRGISNRRVYYNRVIRSVKNNEHKYQLLCANCNWIKRFNDKKI